MPLPLQLHLRSGNRTQHCLLQRSLRYRLLLHNRIQHSVPLPQNIRSPAQDITVRNTELRNHRSGWKPSLNRLCLLPLPPLSPQPLSPLRLSLPLRSLLLLRLLYLRFQSCILRCMDTAIACCQYGCKNFFLHGTLLLLFINTLVLCLTGTAFPASIISLAIFGRVIIYILFDRGQRAGPQALQSVTFCADIPYKAFLPRQEPFCTSLSGPVQNPPATGP